MNGGGYVIFIKPFNPFHLLYNHFWLNKLCNQSRESKMPNKNCKWGTCKSDSRRDKDVVFFAFPKPCKDFKLLHADPTLVAIQHFPDSCLQCSRCIAWINACSIEGFTSLDQITANCYVCNKHFLDGKPTKEQPNPICARSFSHVSHFHFLSSLHVQIWNIFFFLSWH